MIIQPCRSSFSYSVSSLAHSEQFILALSQNPFDEVDDVAMCRVADEGADKPRNEKSQDDFSKPFNLNHESFHNCVPLGLEPERLEAEKRD
jgi:hypothetical protein